MKTAVTGEDGEGHIVYNRSLLALAQHYGFLPRACRPYRAKTKGKVERPFRYIREDFFLGRRFRNLDDLNAQLADWLDTVANVARCMAPRSASSPRRLPPSSPSCRHCPRHPSTRCSSSSAASAMTASSSIGGNYYSVPDRTRRVVEVQQLARPDPHPRSGPHRRRPSCSGRPRAVPHRPGSSQGAAGTAPCGTDAPDGVTIGRRPAITSARARWPSTRRSATTRARCGEPAMTARRPHPRRPRSTASSRAWSRLRMPRALEMLDATLRRIEQGEIDAHRGAR